MIEWYQVISYLVTNVIRIFLGLFLITELLKFPKTERKMGILSMSSAFLITILSMLQIPQICLTGVEIIILTAIVHCLYHKETRICLFLVFFYEVSVTLWKFLISSGLGILFQSDRFLDSNTRENLIAVWIVALIMMGIVGLIIKNRSAERKGIFQLSTFFAVSGIFCVVALSEQSVITIDDDLLTIHLSLSVLIMVSVLVYKLNCQYEMEKEIARLKTEQAELLERDYQTLKRSYSVNAKLFHDLHNHIKILHSYLTQEKISDALQYLEDLRTPVQEITQSDWTGDEAIDYLISSKMALAEHKNIQTKVNVEYPHNTNIRSVDLTTILGNLLDNALEAVETAPDHLRFLNLTVRRINDMLIIKVENGCGEAPEQEDGKWLTSKTDKAFHGWGLKSVLTATERYDGTINTDYLDRIFQAVVTLSFHPIKTK